MSTPLWAIASLGGLVAFALSTAWLAARMQRTTRLHRSDLDTNAQQKAILDSSDDAIVTITQDGLIRSFNKSAEKMFLWAEDDILGRNVNILMPEPFKSAHDIYLSRYKLDGNDKRVISKTRELTGVRKDGSEFPMSLTVQKVRRAEPLLFVGFIQDLTEARDQRNHLAHTKRQYNSLLHGMPGVVWSATLEETPLTLFVTDNIAALTGYPPEHFRDQQVALNDLIHPGDLPEALQCRQMARQRSEEYAVPLRLRTCEDQQVSVIELGRVATHTDGSARVQALWLRLDSPAWQGLQTTLSAARC